MRILFLVQNYPPERGPVRYTSSLAAGLAARGHDVRVITGLPHYPEGTAHPGFDTVRTVVRIEDGVEVVRVPLIMASNRQLARRIAGMGTFALSAMPHALAGPRPDVVVASAPPVPVAALGAMIARVRHVPLVTLLRDVEPQITFELRGVDDQAWARTLIDWSNRLYDQADRIVVVHESQEEPLVSHGVAAAKIETIRHGIDVDRFLSQSRLTPPIGPLRRPGRTLVLYAGTLGVAHDVDSLVKAFATPAVRELPVDLALVGQGELASLCDDLIRERRLDNVRRLPPVPLEWVPALLSQADALATSYRTTEKNIAGMIGSKLYEYCAAAKPILVNGEGVAADLVRSVGNGWSFPQGDGHALAAALRSLLESPGAAAEMGARGRAHAQRHFSMRQRHDRWEDLLRSVVEKRAA